MYDYAEQVAVWLLGLSDSGKRLFILAESASVLFLCGGVYQLWHAGRLKAAPYRSERADYLTWCVVRSAPLSAAAASVLLAAMLWWSGMLLVEYAAWKSPEAGAAYREAAAQDNEFQISRREMRGRVAGVLCTGFGLGAAGWGLVCLFRARSHVRTLGEA